MGDLRFTASVLMAIDTMSSIQRGNIFARKKGVAPSADMGAYPTRVPSPRWCNFTFFHRIKYSPIRRTKRVEATADRIAHWEIERRVEFFIHGQLMAVVELVGMKPDKSGLGKHPDNGAFWGVSKVGYFLSQGRIITDPPADWVEVELEPGQTGRPMAE